MAVPATESLVGPPRCLGGQLLTETEVREALMRLAAAQVILRDDEAAVQFSTARSTETYQL